MVKRISLLSLISYFCLCALSLCAEVKVSVSVSSETVGEDQPIPLLISIASDRGQAIDESSFQLGGKPISVQFMGQQEQSQIQIVNGRRSEEYRVVSNYRTELPGRKSGLHSLPSVSVVVDGSRYQSSQLAYSITKAEQSADFKLELAIEGDLPAFPGQRLRAVYRILFIRNIEITASFLPLLDPSAFKTIGEAQTRNYRDNGYHVYEQSQLIEAREVGSFSYGPSYVEGYAYTQNFFGQRSYTKPRLRAEVPSMAVEVKDFPTEGCPASFSGAIGEYTIQARLLSSPSVAVGDKMELELIIFGSGDLQTVELPKLSELPAIKRAFRLSDLPPVAESQSSSKRYKVELRPLSPSIRTIPEIEFSYFSQRTASYHTAKTRPISIEVRGLPADLASQEDTVDDGTEGNSEQIDWTQGFGGPESVAIAGNRPLKEADLSEQIFDTERMVYIIPFLILALLVQMILKRRVDQPLDDDSSSSDQSRKTSADLYKQAFTYEFDARTFYPLVEQALLLRLFEKGHTKGLETSASKLPEEGISGEVRELLLDLEAERFAGGDIASTDPKVIATVQELYRKMR